MRHQVEITAIFPKTITEIDTTERENDKVGEIAKHFYITVFQRLNTLTHQTKLATCINN